MNISAGMFELKLTQRSVSRKVSYSSPHATKVSSELTDCPLGNKKKKTIPTILNCGNQCLGPKRAKTTNDIYGFQHECCKCNMYLCCKPNAVQVRGSQARLSSQIIQYDLRLFKKLQNVETSHFNSKIKRAFTNCWIQFISTNVFPT